jgi:hypothetical protein
MTLHRSSTIALLVASFALAACKRAEPNYCPTATNRNCLELDASNACASNQDCSGATAVCDVAGSQMCVQCTPSDNPCTAAAPVCMANQCQKCTQHAQCATTSNVCSPEGVCEISEQVAYIQAGGTGKPNCTKDAPCGTLAEGLNTGRPIVKLATGTVADNKTTTIDGIAVTILADPGAKLDRTNDGVILEIKNSGADAKVYDLAITGGTGMATDPAISISSGGAPKLSLTRVTVGGNQGLGISATAGALTISQSTISGNTGGGISATAGALTISQSTISGNTGGGISISGSQFDITNSFIVRNGSATATFGGLSISAIGVGAGGAHRLDFDTITANVGPATVNTGVTCSNVLTPLVFSNDIIYDNIVSGGGLQIGGSVNCATAYSDVGPASVAGTGNISADPLFVNVSQADFHLQATSPARDVADPASTSAVDFDGDARPQGIRRDMGADETR